MTPSEGAAHLDRLAIAGTVHLPPSRPRRVLHRWLVEFAALIAGFLAIGCGGFVIWGLVIQ